MLPIDSVLAEQAVTMRKEGSSFLAIARYLGLAQSTVIGVLQRKGLDTEFFSPRHKRLDNQQHACDNTPLRGACRFPLWDNGERPTHKYCAHSRVTGRPYCEEHMAVCYDGVA